MYLKQPAEASRVHTLSAEALIVAKQWRPRANCPSGPPAAAAAALTSSAMLVKFELNPNYTNIRWM
jgi:hypothetical protein